MFKKFVYLASVSVIATTAMVQASYGMDEDQRKAIVPVKPAPTVQLVDSAEKIHPTKTIMML